MAGSPGLEPGKKASKASVIPFHHDPVYSLLFDASDFVALLLNNSIFIKLIMKLTLDYYTKANLCQLLEFLIISSTIKCLCISLFASEFAQRDVIVKVTIAKELLAYS
jgi:hypothetical protein